jgi:spore germination protein GerM
MLPAPVPPPPVQPPPQQVLQERSLYFTQIDRAGMIFRSRVNRRLPASDTPMTDVLRSLMEGPNEDEIRRGLFTLIPPGTQIISATVQGGTAHINFNENFRYNTYGVEGYIGQLRQIIYTVTEFPAVTDVQILIEGRPVDFLGEGIWIGSPIRRGQF